MRERDEATTHTMITARCRNRLNCSTSSEMLPIGKCEIKPCLASQPLRRLGSQQQLSFKQRAVCCSSKKERSLRKPC